MRADDTERPEARRIGFGQKKQAAYARQQSPHAVVKICPLFSELPCIQQALDDDEHARKTEPGERPRRDPNEWIGYKKVHGAEPWRGWRRRLQRFECCQRA